MTNLTNKTQQTKNNCIHAAVIVNRWRIWPAVKQEQTPLKVAEHAQRGSGWKLASTRHSKQKLPWTSISSTYLAEVLSSDLNLKCAECWQKACIIFRGWFQSLMSNHGAAWVKSKLFQLVCYTVLVTDPLPCGNMNSGCYGQQFLWHLLVICLLNTECVFRVTKDSRLADI